MAISAVVGLFAAFRPDPRPAYNPDWYWRLKLEWTGQADIVLAGNSRIYRGLDPAIFEQALAGRTVLNLGFSDQVWSEAYLDLIQKTLKLSAEKTRWIVIGVDPPSLKAVEYSGTPSMEASGFGNALRQQHGALLPARWAVAFTELTQRLAPIDLPLLLGIQQVSAKTSEDYLQDYHVDGWIASNFREQDPERFVRNYWRDRTEAQQKISDATAQRLVARIASWRQLGLRIAAFRPPTTAETSTLEDLVFGFNQSNMERALTSAGALWIDCTDTTLRSYDGSHMIPESAQRLSRCLADAIAKFDRSPATAGPMAK